MDYMTMNFKRNGGGGTSDYSQLTNKPQINGVTLSGNKTSADLGLMPEYEVDNTPTEDSENLITSGGVWEADQSIEGKLQGSKSVSSTSGTIEIPDYGMTESIDMYFKPTQDLHGYDKPWAGGVGKNKFDKDNADILKGYALNPETGFTYPTTDWSISNYIPIEPSTTYTLTTGPSVNNSVAFYDSEKAYISGAASFKTKTTPSNAKYLRFDFKTEHLAVIQLELGSTATAYEPYSNICPISGQDNATFSWTDSHDIENEASMDFGQTYYGGFCQFNGQIYPDWDYIASYNGETLSGEWVSDRDEYIAGTTPTIGAEVAYKTTPSYVRVTPPANLNLTDDYSIKYNGYMSSISYQPKNTVLLQAKEYTNQEIAKLGLPKAPTTDGTYHLECSVSGGIPTIRWVSNS